MGVLYVRMQLNTAWPVVGDAYVVNTTQNEEKNRSTLSYYY